MPTVLSMLMDDQQFDPRDYRYVRAIAYGASPMPTALLERVKLNFPSVRLIQIYGMTEVGIAVLLANRWHRGDDAQLKAAGQAGPFYDVRIVDDEGIEVPRGELGEVVFSGGGIMKGYLNQPALTADVLKGA